VKFLKLDSAVARRGCEATKPLARLTRGRGCVAEDELTDELTAS
jgi:hypothetical protein